MHIDICNDVFNELDPVWILVLYDSYNFFITFHLFIFLTINRQ